jgi:2-succinyl-5-enolpyruvyl-6-hydroxy-3-cyclohexene-1-carboxylate synthase
LTSKHYYTFLKQVPAINLITLNLNSEKEDPSHHTKIRINASISPTLKLLTQELVSVKYKVTNENPLFLNKNFETFTNQKISLIENGPLSYPRISKMIIDSIPNHSILYLGNSTVVRSFDAYFSYQCKKNLIIATNRGVSGIEGFMASSTGFIDGINQDVFLVIGDVSFFHDLNSLHYLKDCKHHLKIILVNNDGGGIFTLLPIHKEEKVLNVISSPHGLTFKSTAEQFGIPYRKVETTIDFEQSLQDIFQYNGHYILEVTFDHETNKKVYDQLKTIKL